MPCFSPLYGYKSSRLSENGKRQIVFKRQQGLVDLPVMTVPCGACIGCRIDRSRSWALRCVHESKMHDANCFITLTYNDENKPYGGSLDKTDLQKFLKRLRKKLARFGTSLAENTETTPIGLITMPLSSDMTFAEIEKNIVKQNKNISYLLRNSSLRCGDSEMLLFPHSVTQLRLTLHVM